MVVGRGKVVDSLHSDKAPGSLQGVPELDGIVRARGLQACGYQIDGVDHLRRVIIGRLAILLLVGLAEFDDDLFARVAVGYDIRGSRTFPRARRWGG